MGALVRATALKPSVFLVLLLAAALRFFNLDIPFLEPFNNYSRQSMCASVARNFYEKGFKLFYPEIDENGTGPSLYNVEFPILPYVMALGYKLAGGVREGIARSVSVFISLGFLWVLYLLVRKAEDELTALWALIFVSLSPMVVALSRSVQPDIGMLFTATTALYLFFCYHEVGKRRLLYFSALFLMLAVAMRIYALYFFLPMIYLTWEKEGVSFLKRPRYYVYALIVCLALSWYAYMIWMGKQEVLCYEPYRHSLATAGMSFFDFLKPAHLLLPGKAVFLHLLTPIGALLFLLGLFEKAKNRRFFLVWLLSTAMYLVLVWRTAVIHPYYFLPLAAPCAFFVAKGAQKIRPFWIVWVLALLVFANVSYYYQKLYFVPKERMLVVEAGKAVDTLTPNNAIVVAAYDSSPIQVYYNHRRGWVMDLSAKDEQALVNELKGWIEKGATHWMTSKLELLNQRPVFQDYLLRHSKPIKLSGRGYAIFDLSERGEQ